MCKRKRDEWDPACGQAKAIHTSPPLAQTRTFFPPPRSPAQSSLAILGDVAIGEEPGKGGLQVQPLRSRAREQRSVVSSSFFGGFQFLATLDGLVRLLSGQFAAAIAFSSDHLVLDPAVARRSSGTGWALRGKGYREVRAVTLRFRTLRMHRQPPPAGARGLTHLSGPLSATTMSSREAFPRRGHTRGVLRGSPRRRLRAPRVSPAACSRLEVSSRPSCGRALRSTAGQGCGFVHS